MEGKTLSLQTKSKKIMMMRTRNLIIAVAALLATSLSACSQPKQKGSDNMERKTTLVAYFSATGTTKSAAERLAKDKNADIFEIVPEQPYTGDDLDWTNKQSRSTVEMKDKQSRPAIKDGKVADLAQYDTVYVGFPIWWYTAPTIINTFIDANRGGLKGKTIITFATSGGSTNKKATKDLQDAYPELTFRQGEMMN